MDLYFLEAGFPLVKTLTKAQGNIEETPYPMAFNFTSHCEQVSSIVEFKTALEKHAADGHSLIKGVLNRSLDQERRAGSTDPFVRTNWLCLDFDNLGSEDDLAELLDRMGLGTTSYILQYSSKHRILKDFSAHLFFTLDQPVLPAQLKLWLMEANLDNKLLSERMSLTRTAAALRWPLDVSLAQNDKIIYIAPPNCVGFKDPVSKRIKLIVRQKNSIDLTRAVAQVDTAQVEEKKHAKLSELRKAQGLKARKFTMKTLHGEEVLSKPGETIVTGKKIERGFVYLNLNGGDSWGYYHPVDNPEIIRNFKGEPNYATKELLPDYYRAFKKQELAEQNQHDGTVRHFAFLDRRTDRYFRGSFDGESLDIFPTDSVRKVEDFLKQNGQIVPDFINEWDYLFRFDDDRVFVPEEKFVNQYQISTYIRNAKTTKVTSFPPTIRKVLESVSGNDPEVLKHLLNWLAVIVQKRQRTQTMWVMHGVPGTGKGVLVHQILAPILGAEYIQVKPLSSLEEEFNHYMEKCVILMIDESKRTQVSNDEKVMAKLKQACTDPVIPIRKMRADPYMAKNYMNIIVASNYPDPITVESGDRRINVANYQSRKLNLDSEDIKRIKDELPQFAALLMQIDVDVERAKTPLDNEARRKLMYLTQTSLESAFGAMRNGDLEFFIDALPTDPDILGDPAASLDQQAYIRILHEAERHALANEPHVLTRDQARLLAQYTLSDMPKTANKFSSLAKHYGITFTRMSKAGKKVQAMKVDWQIGDVRVDDHLDTQRLRAVK